MARVRRPAVAGRFYPDAAEALRSSVWRCLREARASRGGLAKALIVPHAGYVYSGPIAGSAYAALRSVRERIERVVLIGPAHRVRLRGLAAPSAELFQTPLGSVELDQEALEQILSLPQVIVSAEAHALEHSLEVQLPFLQEILGDFKLVPLVVGDATGEEVAEVLERLWGDETTLIVVSTDLSHYEDHVTATRMDAATSKAIEAMDPESISVDGACGRIPVQGLLRVASAHALRAEAVDVRNSGDTCGPRDHVVGYGAYVFS